MSTELEVWDVWELPSIDVMRNVSHDDEYYPCPDGHVRAYYNGELMRNLVEERFSVKFDSKPGEPYGLVFRPRNRCGPTRNRTSRRYRR